MTIELNELDIKHDLFGPLGDYFSAFVSIFSARSFWCSDINIISVHTIVTRPFCLVESHIVKTLPKAGVLCFTSYTFCNNNGSCSLRLNEKIYICIHSSVLLDRVSCYDQPA